jgi:hypothetical protein
LRSLLRSENVGIEHQLCKRWLPCVEAHKSGAQAIQPMVYSVEAANHFAAELLNVVVELAKAPIHLIKASIHLVKACIHLVKAYLHLAKAYLHLAKACIHLVKAPAQAFEGSVYAVEAFVLCHLAIFFFAAFFFAVGGRPTPIDFVSQFGCLHFGQRTGRAATRLTQAWPHRRQSQTIFAGMGMFAMIAGFAPRVAPQKPRLSLFKLAAFPPRL